MVKKLRLLIVLLVAVALFRSPNLQAKYSSIYRQKLFTKFYSQVKSHGLDSENYWQFRERFGSGHFTRNEEAIDFLAIIRIASVNNNLTPLLFYKSSNFNSTDSLLLSSDSSNQLESFKLKNKGEILTATDTFLLIKTGNTNYALAFVKPISEMKKVNGLFDYKSSERELIKDYNWYNETWFSI